MAKENKTQITEVSVADFVAALESETRKQEAEKIIALYEAQTGVAPKMWGPSIIGFGVEHYRYESGR